VCGYLVLLKQSIYNDPYRIYSIFILLIKQIDVIWHVNYKVTFASICPNVTKNKTGKEMCAFTSSIRVVNE